MLLFNCLKSKLCPFLFLLLLLFYIYLDFINFCNLVVNVLCLLVVNVLRLLGEEPVRRWFRQRSARPTTGSGGAEAKMKTGRIIITGGAGTAVGAGGDSVKTVGILSMRAFILDMDARTSLSSLLWPVSVSPPPPPTIVTDPPPLSRSPSRSPSPDIFFSLNQGAFSDNYLLDCRAAGAALNKAGGREPFFILTFQQIIAL